MVEGAVNGFLSYLNLQKRFSPLTTKNYEIDLRQFFEFLNNEIKDVTLSTISFFNIREFVSYLIDSGLSSRSVNRKISTLKSFFKYLLRNGEIDINPTQKIQGPKTPKRLPVFIDENQMDKVFTQFEFPEGFDGVRDRLLIDILYQTGLRRAEILNLKESDVDIYNTQLKVLGKRNKERVIPFDISLKRNFETVSHLKKRKQS